MGPVLASDVADLPKGDRVFERICAEVMPALRSD
jgi:hypothetical protein